MSASAPSLSEEKRAFWWACGWLAALSLAWTGHFIFSHIVHKRMAELLVIADGDYLPEVDAYFSATDPWLDASRAVVILLSSGFLVCLAWWLLAIRQRRRFSSTPGNNPGQVR
ncbi:hypothetical protein OKA04_04210 [Luteolibacter flavescens]|uniref:Transmembrane protein n=1 Tax=Luteolibacter flavescens TaxID=1859460 RepID=A0ABT3FK26_9BACT|nr:hypothetical protein [Luteolibacter flavescens]MCW1883918.1 hypothetical protein [Luteolibacter flavescens]